MRICNIIAYRTEKMVDKLELGTTKRKKSQNRRFWRYSCRNLTKGEKGTAQATLSVRTALSEELQSVWLFDSTFSIVFVRKFNNY